MLYELTVRLYTYVCTRWGSLRRTCALTRSRVRRETVLRQRRPQGERQVRRRLQPACARLPTWLSGSYHRLRRRVSIFAVSQKVAARLMHPDIPSVGHPGPGSYLPSIAGVVASSDPHGTRYDTAVRAQNSREEIVSCLVPLGIVATAADESSPDRRPRGHGV